MFPILKRQLSEHSNGAKHITVLLKIVSVLLPQNLPLLETFIACFVLAPNPLLHSLAIGGGLAMQDGHLTYSGACPGSHHQPQHANIMHKQ